MEGKPKSHSGFNDMESESRERGKESSTNETK